VREITESVELCLADGTLNPEAVGWSRHPVHRTRLHGWGRNKRWEYWCVMTPTQLVALTVSDIDYLAVSSVYLLEYGGVEAAAGLALPLGAGARLPVTLGDRTFEFADEAWAVLDHGRGRWPYYITWNWGAASGRCAGHYRRAPVRRKVDRGHRIHRERTVRGRAAHLSAR
jgi:hypothetical protein